MRLDNPDTLRSLLKMGDARRNKNKRNADSLSEEFVQKRARPSDSARTMTSQASERSLMSERSMMSNDPRLEQQLMEEQVRMEGAPELVAEQLQQRNSIQAMGGSFTSVERGLLQEMAAEGFGPRAVSPMDDDRRVVDMSTMAQSGSGPFDRVVSGAQPSFNSLELMRDPLIPAGEEPARPNRGYQRQESHKSFDSGELVSDTILSDFPAPVLPKVIVLGRGAGKNKANEGYREFVKQHAPEYAMLSNKDEKTQYSKNLVDTIKELGSVFVKCDAKGNETPVDDERARERVAQLLRETVKSMKKQYEGANGVSPEQSPRMQQRPTVSAPQNVQVPPSTVPGPEGAVLPAEIIFGRGPGKTKHNQGYRDFVKGYAGEYARLDTKDTKTRFTENVIKIIRDRGSKFVKDEKGQRVPVPDDKVREKVSQLLREEAAKLKKAGLTDAPPPAPTSNTGLFATTGLADRAPMQQQNSMNFNPTNLMMATTGTETLLTPDVEAEDTKPAVTPEPPKTPSAVPTPQSQLDSGGRRKIGGTVIAASHAPTPTSQAPSGRSGAGNEPAPSFFSRLMALLCCRSNAAVA